jgi:hypothetical protein
MQPNPNIPNKFPVDPQYDSNHEVKSESEATRQYSHVQRIQIRKPLNAPSCQPDFDALKSIAFNAIAPEFTINVADYIVFEGVGALVKTSFGRWGDQSWHTEVDRGCKSAAVVTNTCLTGKLASW